MTEQSNKRELRVWDAWTVIHRGSMPGPRSSGGKFHMNKRDADNTLGSLDPDYRVNYEVIKIRITEVVE